MTTTSDGVSGEQVARASDGRRLVPRGPSTLATIRDVAAEAGVSISTVSRALNDNGYVSDDVRERVMTVARRLAFQPSRRAWSMRSLRTMMIGAIVPEFVNPVNVEFVRGVETAANERGYVVTVATSLNSPQREAEILRRMLAERADGVILSTTVGPESTRQALVDNNIQVIPPVAEAAVAQTRAWQSAEASIARQVGERLISLGHRKVAIAYFAQRSGTRTPRGMRRVPVLRRTLDAGGASLEQVVLPAERDFSASSEVVAAAAARCGAPTAWLAANHLVLPGVLAGLGAARVRIPRDASVVTYGDSEWARAFRPPISVIARDFFAEARETTVRLLAAIEGQPLDLTGITYESTLVERASLGPAPAR